MGDNFGEKKQSQQKKSHRYHLYKGCESPTSVICIWWWNRQYTAKTQSVWKPKHQLSVIIENFTPELWAYQPPLCGTHHKNCDIIHFINSAHYEETLFHPVSIHNSRSYGTSFYFIPAVFTSKCPFFSPKASFYFTVEFFSVISKKSNA